MKMTKTIADLTSLLVNNQSVEHEIKVNEDDEDTVMKIWIKELSFMQSVDIDLAAYWKYMFAEAIDKSEPRLTIPQMLSLKPFVAQQIIALLPQPQDLMSNPLAGGATE